MKKILGILIIVFVTAESYSQSDFREGYIITNKGDTLLGFIDYSEGNANYKVANYKKMINSDVISYKPNQIKSYRFVDDKFFEATYIFITPDSPQLVFLEVLVKGKTSLFKYNYRYFVSKESKLYELKNERKIVVIEGKEVYKTSNEYIGILSYLLSDCKGFQFKKQNLGINTMDLSKLIEDYNNCSGVPTVSYIGKLPLLKVAIGADIGFSVSSLKLSSDELGLEYLTNAYNTDGSFSFGVNFKFSSPRLIEKVFFYTGVYYSNSNYSSINMQEYSHLYIIRNEVFIDVKQLKIPLGLGYTHINNKIASPFFNLGISINHDVGSSGYRIREVEKYLIVNPSEVINDVLELKRNQIGYWAGIGLKRGLKNKAELNLEIRYDIINSEALGLPTFNLSKKKMDYEMQNIQILLGIRF